MSLQQAGQLCLMLSVVVIHATSSSQCRRCDSSKPLLHLTHTHTHTRQVKSVPISISALQASACRHDAPADYEAEYEHWVIKAPPPSRPLGQPAVIDGV